MGVTAGGGGVAGGVPGGVTGGVTGVAAPSEARTTGHSRSPWTAPSNRTAIGRALWDRTTISLGLTPPHTHTLRRGWLNFCCAKTRAGESFPLAPPARSAQENKLVFSGGSWSVLGSTTVHAEEISFTNGPFRRDASCPSPRTSSCQLTHLIKVGTGHVEP